MTTYVVTPNMNPVASASTPDSEVEQLRRALAEAKAENAKLIAAKTDGLSIRVSEKGGISVYGMGRFPVTLYLSQWEKLLSHAEDIKAFALANVAKLAVKPTK